MKSSCRVRSTMKKFKIDLMKDSSYIEVSDESSSINLDEYNSLDDSDFAMDDESTNETESMDDDKPSGVDEDNIR